MIKNWLTSIITRDGIFYTLLILTCKVLQMKKNMKERCSEINFLMITISANLNKALTAKYNINKLIVSDENYQLCLNHHSLDSAKLDIKEVQQWIIDQLLVEPGIFRAFPLSDLNKVPLPEHIRNM